MSINVESREKYRKAVALFFKNHITSAKNVLDHVPARLDGQTPLVCITGAPTNRIPDGGQGPYENKFGLSARLITLYFKEGETWTPANAEDMIDKLEYETAIALKEAQRQSNANPWRSISRNGISIFEGPYLLGGVQYLMEIVPILVEVEDGETE